jgi:hypothetical protein
MQMGGNPDLQGENTKSTLKQQQPHQQKQHNQKTTKKQADPARAIEGQHVKEYAKHGGENRLK